MKIGDLEVTLVRKNIKHLYIRIYPPNGEIRVICPQKLDARIIEEFVTAKTDWIEGKRAKFVARPPQIIPQYVTGESCYFKGDRYLLEVIYHHKAPRVEIEGDCIRLYVRYGSIHEQREQALINWYRQQLKAEIPSLISKWESIVGVQINDWGVKKMKTRWGTCNTKAKRIWLNLELVKQPHHCLEYVIVHELVHLLERKHNQHFWNYVSQFMPEWEISHSKLNRTVI